MALQLPFIKKEEKKTPQQIKQAINKLQSELKSEFDKIKKADPIAGRLHEFGFANPVIDKKSKRIVGWTGQESFEKHQHRIVKTDFPDPARRFRLVLEYANFNIENTYYWFLTFFNEMWGFEKVEKIIDTLASSVASSNFANLQTRLSAQQAQASQYLKGISEMVKGLFQIVRELRIIDERLQYYYDSDNDVEGIKESALSSEIVLKGLWIDQVEGGAKNPASIYGLAQTVGFTILPDLFFRVKIKDRKSLESEVDKLKFNEKVKEVLKRKLRQYYEWKWRTKKELQVRRQFELKYLRQHYDTIKLYMSWVKPYLKNIRRLQLYEKNMEDANLINAFETQIIEIETLFVRQDFGSHSAVISLHLFYRVKPELAYHSYEYQHKGPIYQGMADITIRAYSWTNDQIENYINYRKYEDLELMTTIDKSVAQAMDSLGDELKKYLKEAGEDLPFPGEEAKKAADARVTHPDILDPFISIFKGCGEIFQGFAGAPIKKGGKKVPKPKKPSAKDLWKKEKSDKRAKHFAAEACWESYYRYKMGPGGNLYWIE